MAKFNFSISALIGNDMMLVYSRDFFVNMTEFAGGSPVFGMCMGTMGYRDWTFDDGDDAKGTTYCQYVSYDVDNHDNYLLAVWCEIDEESGCMKL
jgi:hypothetical protein